MSGISDLFSEVDETQEQHTPPATTENGEPSGKTETEETSEEEKARLAEEERLKKEQEEKDKKPEGDEDLPPIWEDVNKLTGFGLEGEFGEDVQGVADYSKALYQKAQDDFDTLLKQANPEAYNVMQYALRGGQVADLYRNAPNLPEKVDTEIDAESVLATDLREKGLDVSVINTILSKYKEDNVLVEQANSILESRHQLAEQDKQRLLFEQQQKQQQEDTMLDTITNNIAGFVKEGIFDVEGKQAMIPETDKQGFFDFLQERIQVDNNGQVLAVHPLNAYADLQYEFIRFKQGNISDIVATKQQSQRTGRFLNRRGIEQPDNTNPVNRISSLFKQS